MWLACLSVCFDGVREPEDWVSNLLQERLVVNITTVFFQKVLKVEDVGNSNISIDPEIVCQFHIYDLFSFFMLFPSCLMITQPLFLVGYLALGTAAQSFFFSFLLFFED